MSLEKKLAASAPRRCAPVVVLLACLWLPHALAATEARPVPSEAQAPDGKRGGTIPSALPGWTPNPGDAHDAYVYVPREGWRLGDTPRERAAASGPPARPRR